MNLKLKFKHKIIAITTFAGLLPIIVVLILTRLMGSNVTGEVNEKFQEQTLINISQIAKDAYNLCEMSNNLLVESVQHNLNVARKEIREKGGVKLSSENVSWKAVNQFSQKVKEVGMPKFLIGSQWLKQNKDFATETFVVDDVIKLVGGTITIFQRMNNDGDMLRVATNVKKLDGTRAIGTYIPAVNPDGKPNPVVSKVLNGETYIGRAFVVNAWYITVYEPIKDLNGNLIGMLYAGIQQDAVASITNSIKNVSVGSTGNVTVFGGKGDDFGKILVDHDDKVLGSYIFDLQNEETNTWLKENFTKAIQAGKGGVVTGISQWKEAGETEAKPRLTAITYFEPWDWLIVPSAFVEDFSAIQTGIDSSLDQLQIAIILGGLIIFILTLTAALFFGKKISDPITGITEISQLIARGDIDIARNKVIELKKKISTAGNSYEEKLNKMFYSPHDETNRLLNSIGNMTDKLNSMISQLRNSSYLLSSTSADITTTSKQQEATIAEFNATTSEVAAATKEISATTNNLVNTMSEVSIKANETKNFADSGKQSIDEMSETIRNLVGVTESVSKKLSLINKNADNISDIISTITKVADQTNLLSLNAAIEAEKAGKYGKGFSVVAKEIRRLADQTAVATLDIEKMIKEMQSSVKSGVEEMDKFFVEVRLSVSAIEVIKQQLEKIIKNVHEISPRFIAVNDGMMNQAQGADQINEAIMQLSASAEETAAAIKGFNKVAEELNEAVQNLENEIEQFHADGNTSIDKTE